MTERTELKQPFKFLPGRPPGPPKKDPRTFKFKAIIKKGLPPAPETFDVDVALGILLDSRMWLNDTYGCCVVAAFCAQLLRNEKFEQGVEVYAPDSDVEAEYFQQTGGADSGLDPLGYLNHLRKEGILVDGKRYKIHAFASFNTLNHEEFRLAVSLMHGAFIGCQVPQSMEGQFNAGQIFDVVPDDGGILGGHMVYSPAYLEFSRVEGVNEIGPIIRTWSKRVQATWPWADKYIDCGYIIIDERDEWIDPETNPVDTDVLEKLLSGITKCPPEPDPVPAPPAPTPPDPPKPGCLFSSVSWIWNR